MCFSGCCLSAIRILKKNVYSDSVKFIIICPVRTFMERLSSQFKIKRHMYCDISVPRVRNSIKRMYFKMAAPATEFVRQQSHSLPGLMSAITIVLRNS